MLFCCAAVYASTVSRFISGFLSSQFFSIVRSNLQLKPTIIAWMLISFGAITFLPLLGAQLVILLKPYGQKAKDILIGKGENWRDKTHFRSAFAWLQNKSHCQAPVEIPEYDPIAQFPDRTHCILVFLQDR